MFSFINLRYPLKEVRMKPKITCQLILTLLVLMYVIPFTPHAAAASNLTDEFDALRANMFTYFTEETAMIRMTQISP